MPVRKTCQKRLHIISVASFYTMTDFTVWKFLYFIITIFLLFLLNDSVTDDSDIYVLTAFFVH